MNNFADVLNSFTGKVLKNVVVTVSIGGTREKLNVAQVHSVGEVAELTIEAIDHRSKDITMKCFVRVCDVSSVVFPSQEDTNVS